MRFVRNRVAGWYDTLALVFALTLVLAPLRSAFSDESTISQWNQILTRAKLPDNWRFYLDTHPRFDLESSQAHGKAGVRQFLVRPAVGYSWTKYLETYAGYTLVENYNPHSTEHDVIEDILYTRPVLGLKTLQRLRAEQRFFETDGEVGHRWRYLYQSLIPIASEDGVSLVLSDEVFFALNDVSASTRSGFSENRAFAGLGIKLEKDLQMNFGYMNQYKEGRGGADDSMNHILLAVAIIDFDFSG